MRDYLRQLRKAAGLTQKDVADAIGISLPYYNQIERGNRGTHLGVARCAHLANVLGVNASDFFKMELKCTEVNR